MGGRGVGGAQGFWSPAYLATVVPGGGRMGFGCPLTLPLVFFSAPIPPTPFPSGEGGDFRLFYARGSAPCIPGAERGAALAEPAVQETEGGRRGFGCPLTLPLACFPAPIPRPPSPPGKGGILLYFAGGYRPRHPCNRVGRGTGTTFSYSHREPLILP